MIPEHSYSNRLNPVLMPDLGKLKQSRSSYVDIYWNFSFPKFWLEQKGHSPATWPYSQVSHSFWRKFSSPLQTPRRTLYSFFLRLIIKNSVRWSAFSTGTPERWNHPPVFSTGLDLPAVPSLRVSGVIPSPHRSSRSRGGHSPKMWATTTATSTLI